MTNEELIIEVEELKGERALLLAALRLVLNLWVKGAQVEDIEFIEPEIKEKLENETKEEKGPKEA